MLSMILQYVHLLSGFIFILLSHSLQVKVLRIILYWNVYFEVCKLQMKGILRIVFQKLLSLNLTFELIFSHAVIALGILVLLLIRCQL